MFRFYVKVALLTHVLPVTIFLLFFMILFFSLSGGSESTVDCYTNYYGYETCDSYDSGGGTGPLWGGLIFLFLEILYLTAGLHGLYRLIKSQIYSYHVAVLRDGVHVVMDDHLETNFPILAGLHVGISCPFSERNSGLAAHACPVSCFVLVAVYRSSTFASL